jgi:hypothetical protein
MKKRFRTFIAAVTGLMLCACANPYADQIRALDARYAAGKISRRAYLAQRRDLEVNKAEVDRENAHLALGAAAVGTAIAGTVVASQNRPGGGPGGGGRPPGGGGGAPPPR